MRIHTTSAQRGRAIYMFGFSLKKCFATAKTEYIKWICDARMIIFAVLLIFIYNFAIIPLLDNAELMGKPLNMLEPFVAIANSKMILLIIPLVFLTLIADFPKIDTNTLFYIVRVGRINWVVGQILKLVFMAITVITAVFIGAVVPMLGRGFWGSQWSEVAKDFVDTFPEMSGSFGVELLPANLYNQRPLLTLAVQSYVLLFAYLLVIGLLLLFFSLIRQKITGFILCGGVITAGAALCAINSRIMWATPMAHSIIWMHYTKYFREPIVSMEASVVYFVTVIFVLIVFCCVAITFFDYDNVTEIAM